MRMIESLGNFLLKILGFLLFSFVRSIKNNHIRYIHARLTEEEYAHMKLQMTTHGYPSISGYLRDLIMLKRLPPRRVVCRITDRELRDRINILIYQVNKIGVNYNQVVTLYQKQSKPEKVVNL